MAGIGRMSLKSLNLSIRTFSWGLTLVSGTGFLEIHTHTDTPQTVSFPWVIRLFIGTEIKQSV